MQHLVIKEHALYYTYAKVVGYIYRCGVPIPRFVTERVQYDVTFFEYFTDLFVEQLVNLRDYVIKYLQRHRTTFYKILQQLVLFIIILIML